MDYPKALETPDAFIEWLQSQSADIQKQCKLLLSCLLMSQVPAEQSARIVYVFATVQQDRQILPSDGRVH